MFRGINVVSVPVTDLDLARRFYGETLGLGMPLYDLPDVGWVEFGTGVDGGNVAVTTAGAEGAGAPGATIVLNVDDCAAAAAELRARGVRCDDPETFPGYVTVASFYDPFGNRLQICSPA
ncbi:VOC family protein [Sphingosinicella sp. CPCC 101087]|uniref:VOC family protein n=1 Tax=Sphingosinicella sp. CPCC 101087 TaxID=2497754 RepID=UPI001980710C|nr:VOC family protein [Sphingosinicella sp. CPCC 101087]